MSAEAEESEVDSDGRLYQAVCPEIELTASKRRSSLECDGNLARWWSERLWHNEHWFRIGCSLSLSHHLNNQTSSARPVSQTFQQLDFHYHFPTPRASRVPHLTVIEQAGFKLNWARSIKIWGNWTLPESTVVKISDDFICWGCSGNLHQGWQGMLPSLLTLYMDIP